jgi:hypothetical protein
MPLILKKLMQKNLHVVPRTALATPAHKKCTPEYFRLTEAPKIRFL